MKTNLQNTRFLSTLAAGMMTLALTVALSLVAPPAEGKGPGGGGGSGGGGNGGGGEPVPEGTLYYLASNSIRGVSADGNGDKLALPFNAPSDPEPSNLLYNSGGSQYRLWLRSLPSGDTYYFNGNPVAQRDIYVYREDQNSDATDSFQLTDFFGSFIVQDFVRWSNDGQDSFISFKGIDVRNAYEIVDGKLQLNGSGIRGIFRIDISGSEIDGEPLISNPQFVETITTGGSGYGGNYEHSWSKDGTKVAYILDNGQDQDVWVKEVGGADNNIFPGSGITQNPRFSPKDDIIAIHDYPDVVLVNLAVNPVTENTVVQSGGYGAYWSPDGKHLSFSESKVKGPNVKRFLSRISLETGTITQVLELQGNIILPWGSNEPFVPEPAL